MLPSLSSRGRARKTVAGNPDFCLVSNSKGVQKVTVIAEEGGIMALRLTGIEGVAGRVSGMG